MAYRFALETLLKHRKRQEEIAQRDFQLAQHEVKQSLLRVDEIYAKMNESREMAAQVERQPTADVRALAQLHDFIEGSKVRMAREQERARELMQLADEKLVTLQDCAREHKSIERLKEKRSAEYKKAEKKKELKLADDLVTMRAKKGVGA